jgi:hypothetical protein
VSQLFLPFSLGGISPGSATVCLLLVSGQLPDYLLLLTFAGPGVPLTPFELTLQLGPKRLLSRHHCLRFHNSKSGLSRQDLFLTPGSGAARVAFRSYNLYALFGSRHGSG